MGVVSGEASGASAAEEERSDDELRMYHPSDFYTTIKNEGVLIIRQLSQNPFVSTTVKQRVCILLSIQRQDKTYENTLSISIREGVVIKDWGDT